MVTLNYAGQKTWRICLFTYLLYTDNFRLMLQQVLLYLYWNGIWIITALAPILTTSSRIREAGYETIVSLYRYRYWADDIWHCLIWSQTYKLSQWNWTVRLQVCLLMIYPIVVHGSISSTQTQPNPHTRNNNKPVVKKIRWCTSSQ